MKHGEIKIRKDFTLIYLGLIIYLDKDHHLIKTELVFVDKPSLIML